MNFITPEFVIFFCLAFLFLWTTRSKSQYHLLVLLLFNSIFYLFLGILPLLILLSVIIVTYLGAYGIHHAKHKGYPLALSILFLVGCLAYFKYSEFILSSLQNLFQISAILSLLHDWHIVYIAGISFFTFQALSYLIDLYRGAIEKPLSFSELASYISFFPTILSGPILRATDFVRQIPAPLVSREQILEGFSYILSGLFKKVVISGYLSQHIVKGVFAAPEAYSSLAVTLGIYGYAIQIFCDFSGYTDLAIGIGRLLGYDLPQNFKSPYLATSLQDFWRRWHISFSLWLRDYLYFSLGGSRYGNVYWNLFLTMLIGGLWHGSAWTFILWGAIHGLFLVVHRLYIKHFSQIQIPKALAIFLTFHCVSLLWIPFNAESLEKTFAILSRLVECDLSGNSFTIFSLLAILSGLAIQFCGKFFHRVYTDIILHTPWYISGFLIGASGVIIMFLGPDGVLPFIYFGF